MSNELERLQAELAEAHDVRRAIADVMAIVANTRDDLGSVLQQLAEIATRLCVADGAVVAHWVGDVVNLWSPRGHVALPADAPALYGKPGYVAYTTNQPVRVTHPIDDLLGSLPVPEGDVRPAGTTHGSALAVPMKTAVGAVGTVAVTRYGNQAFGDRQQEILELFAAQAVIAIENARLFNALQQSNAALANSVERESALSRIAQRINEHPLDLDGTLITIADAARRLTDGDSARVWFRDKDQMLAGPGVVAGAPSNLDSSLPEIAAAAKQLTFAEIGVVQVIEGDRVTSWGGVLGPRSYSAKEFMTLNSEFESRSIPGVALVENRIVEFAGSVDALRVEFPEMANVVAEGRGGLERAYLAVPLPASQGREGASGSIMVARLHATPFSEAQRTILLTLADQAVIALQNARLFGELEARNKEITEALRREEAGSAILRQISSSPEQIEDTLQAIAEAVLRLTGMSASVWSTEGDIGVVRGRARKASDPANVMVGNRYPLTADTQRALAAHTPTQRTSAQQPSDTERIFGTTSWAMAPMVRGDELIGFISIAEYAGNDVPSSAVSLLAAFADQASIAIENARLIRELRESNQTISENLDRQTVMGRVMAIVASAPSDLDATLPPIAAAAKHLCNADLVAVNYRDGGVSHVWDDIRGHFDVGAVRLKGVDAGASFPGAAMLENRAIEVVGPIEEWAAQYPIAAEINRADGRTSLAALAVPMPGPDGPIGAITVFRNEARPFTARHRLILEALANQAVVAVENARLFKQLRTKSEELEIASRHKSEFLANMSHELRTPLNAIIGYAELLQEECEDLGQQEFIPDLGKIHSAGKHLLTLISGILDLSKVEAGRMTMFLEDFDVATLIRDADAIVRPLVEKNSNTFVIDCPDDIGVMHADLVKVRQVLFNLLSNSAKFTEGGSITLTVRKPVAEATVTFAIRDTGIGMTEAQLGRLFEAFSQASAETSRKYGGTGLGLALSREFCRMMGGDIAVTSEAGAGSTFTVTLPVQCIDTESAS